MTITCAIHQPGVGTWIGSDRLRSGGYRIIMDKSKWVSRNGWSIAVDGYARAIDVIEHTPITAPEVGDGVFALANWIRDALIADGFTRISSDGDENLAANLGSGFIVATPAGVWDIDAGFAISPIPPRRLHARGSGADYALGAAWTLRNTHIALAEGVKDVVFDVVNRQPVGVELQRGVPHAMPPSRLFVEVAVQAAIEHDGGCGGEPYIHLLDLRR